MVERSRELELTTASKKHYSLGSSNPNIFREMQSQHHWLRFQICQAPGTAVGQGVTGPLVARFFPHRIL